MKKPTESRLTVWLDWIFTIDPAYTFPAILLCCLSSNTILGIFSTLKKQSVEADFGSDGSAYSV